MTVPAMRRESETSFAIRKFIEMVVPLATGTLRLNDERVVYKFENVR
jgi:hypothetical protein